MLKINGLLFCLNVHLDPHASCWEEYAVEILGESAVVSYLILEIFVSDSKDMVNLHILTRRLVVFLWIGNKFRGNFNLSFVMVCSVGFFCGGCFLALIIVIIVSCHLLAPNFLINYLIIRIYSFLLEEILIFSEYRIEFPYQDRLFLTT